MTPDDRIISTTKDLAWRFWFALPIYPYSKRQTIRTEVLADTIWTFDQIQGVFYVIVPIRMTVVKLCEGGLLVYAPVAPTGECLRLVNELVAVHGEIKYIILPTISGLEHKVFVGPFARQFPQAQVWVTPEQWSFPVNLPLSWLGFPAHRTFTLPVDSSKTPFGSEFDYAILASIDLGPGQFAEVAFFHRQSHTLLVTDSLISIPTTPPAIVATDSTALLFHAKNLPTDTIADTPANRLLGWWRICLFAVYFRPSLLEIRKWSDTLQASFKAPNRSKQSYFGIYPFDWKPGWEKTFEILRNDGKLLVAPILQSLILTRAPQSTLDWVNRVAEWDFQTIIPCHFDAPIAATPTEFRQAFAFFDTPAKSTVPDADVRLIREIDRQLVKWWIIKPSQKL